MFNCLKKGGKFIGNKTFRKWTLKNKRQRLFLKKDKNFCLNEKKHNNVVFILGLGIIGYF